MWLKIKVWTKVVLFAVLAIYGLLFILFNKGSEVTFWYWFGHEPKMPALILALGAFISGIVVTILLRTTFKTIGQVRELQSRSRAQRLAREMEQMKTKAAMLRTRDAAGGGGAEAAASPAEPTPVDPAP
jgi:uncharacterized integral membrane protein